MKNFKHISNYAIIIILIIVVSFFSNCKNNINDKLHKQDIELAATVNGKKIILDNIDSMVSSQIYEIRMQALEILISRYLLESEANKQNILLKKLVEKEINQKCKKISNQDFNNYIKQSNITNIDTNSILNYLALIKGKERQIEYVDSLKSIYTVKILLQPSFFKKVEMSDIYSHNIIKNNSKIQVFIISDFSCPACLKAEDILKKLYKKYNNNVSFEFIYFSDYVENSALACEAAAKQDKFRQMHNVIFENADSLYNDSIYYDFAKKIDLDLEKFKKDMQDKNILKTLLQNKDKLILKEIYSTPTFIVNGNVLDNKYSINYLENVIIQELKKR
ncbi:MAG: thioredoxin domain-containing protein [Bacteroidales bacterium]|nr:thioredoxin domain-containing protein [Bacteroidales bacterium]